MDLEKIILNKVRQFSSVAQSCPTLCDPMNHRQRKTNIICYHIYVKSKK